jgi:GTPase SAR1 family protein
MTKTAGPTRITLKVAVIGDSGVGKTCIAQRYTTGGFSGMVAF